MNASRGKAAAPQRILVCQQRQIGDVLLAAPALELLHGRFPQAELHLFTEKKCEPLLRHNPHISRFHLLDKSETRSLLSQFRWYREAASCRFDLVVDFQQLPRCRMLTRLSGAPMRLSFPSFWRFTRLYNHTTPPDAGYAAASKVSLLAPLGLRWRGERPSIRLTEEERAEAHALLASAGLGAEHILISVDPTHRRASKRWPAASYVRLLDRLAETDERLRFLLLRGPGEEDEARAIRRALARPERALLPQPMPALRLSAACMERAALHLGSCSAPRHMAVALDIPSLVIPGASGPEWLYPEPYARGRHRELRPVLPCQPCSKIACDDPLCLTLISPDMAAEQVLDMLGLS